jgi:hypothetical protein
MLKGHQSAIFPGGRWVSALQNALVASSQLGLPVDLKRRPGPNFLASVAKELAMG